MSATISEAFRDAAVELREDQAEGAKRRSREAVLAFLDWTPSMIQELCRLTAYRVPGIPWADIEEGVQTAMLQVVEQDRFDLLQSPTNMGAKDLPAWGLVKHLAVWRTLDMRRRREFRNHSLDMLIEACGNAPLPENDIRQRDIDFSGAEIRLLVERIRELVDHTPSSNNSAAKIAEELGVHKWIVLYVRREYLKTKGPRPRPPHWTRESIIETFQNFALEHGRPPTTNDLEKDPLLPSMRPVYRVFTGMSAALKAAGFDVEKPLTAHDAALQIRAWKIQHGRWPSTKDYINDEALPQKAQVSRLFGTVAVSLVSAKVEQLLRSEIDIETAGEPTKFEREPWTDERFANCFREFERRHGRLPTFDEIRAGQRLGLPPSNATEDRFGTRSAAKIVAKLRESLGDDIGIEGIVVKKSNGKVKWTDAKIARAFEEFERRHGRLPLHRELGPANKLPTTPVLEKRFNTGSIPCALAALREI